MAISPSSKPGSYFVDQKKGEVNELKILLRNINVERDPRKMREVVKKVIAYMTLGIDVSRLFSEMVLASQSKDIVIKKMVYLYLCTYCKENEELAVLVINTLHKDCCNEDPMIRGLALRSLLSLNLSSILEYVMGPLEKSLVDRNAYVRKTGVMGILKLWHLAPDMVVDLIDKLHSLMKDNDGQVVTNCIVVLNEIMVEKGGITINQAVIIHLLNRIKSFNEWGQCVVLDLVARYKPANQDETFAIMNLLDSCLRVNNSAVVISCTKVFLNLTASMKHIQEQVYTRLKTPLLTLMAFTSNEVAYCVLSHVRLLVERCRGIFDDEFKQFYCHYNEATHVQYLKIDILPLLANDSNAVEIATELSEHVADLNEELSKRCITAIGKIGLYVPSSANKVTEMMLEFIEMDIATVRSATVIVLQDLLRRYTERAEDIIPCLNKVLKRVTDPEGVAAIIWMIGEYGQDIEKAPYIIEPMIDSFEEQDILVKKVLLTTGMKMFFKRPPEMQHMLGRLLSYGISDNTSSNIRDKALFYYRMLSNDINKAKDVVLGAGAIPFALEDTYTLSRMLYKEFNTLSVVYRQNSMQFISDDYQVIPAYEFEDNDDDDVISAGLDSMSINTSSTATTNQDTTNGIMGGDIMNDIFSTTDTNSTSQNHSTQAYSMDDFLGMGSSSTTTTTDAVVSPPVTQQASSDDLLDFLGGDGGVTSVPVLPDLNTPKLSQLTLIAGSVLEPAKFQGMWSSLPAAGNVKLGGSSPAVNSQGDYETAVASKNINCMASGDMGTAFKFYFYAYDDAENWYLAEIILQKSNGEASGVFKSSVNNDTNSSQFVEILSDALSSVGGVNSQALSGMEFDLSALYS